MGEYNGSMILMGIKEEAVSGVAETLVDADYYEGYLDAELAQYSSDHSQNGKQANGSLLNTSTSYARSSAGTVPVKFELTKTATPSVAPYYFSALKLAGMKTGVIDAGTNDNYEVYYDGKPDCITGTIVTAAVGCGDNNYNKQLRGAVIADGTISIEGNGAPLMFAGTASGGFGVPANVSESITPTEQDENAIQGTGMLFAIGATAYNVTAVSVPLNLGATMVSDWSEADGSNVSHFKLAEGGQTTLTFSAIPISPDGVEDYDALLNSVKSGELVGENADAKLIISDVQFTDIQDSSDPVMVTERTAICGEIRIQLK